MTYQFKRGDKLVLELINSEEILEGEFVDGSEDRLTLMKITSYTNNHVIKGPYSYYRSDISSVKVLEEFQESTNNIEEPDQHNSNCILISKLEYEHLKTISRNYIYMTTLDARYYAAINSIRNCETIGLAGIATSHEKTASLSLLSFSTLSEVYILDFLTLNTEKFPSGLKEVLECKHVKKVLHDSRLLTEILLKRYKVKLTNIFDTKVADVALQRKYGKCVESTKSLIECLVNYFNFPATLMGSEDTKWVKWKKRPLSDIDKFKAAQMSTFLIILKKHLEHELLSDFYDAVDEYSNSLQQYSLSEVPEKLFDNKLCDVLRNMHLK